MKPDRPSSEHTGQTARLAGQLDALESRLPTEWQVIQPELQDVLNEARRRQDQHAEARALCLLGGCAYYQVDLLATLRYCEEALPLSRQQRDTQLEARLLNAIGLAKQGLHQHDEALSYYLESLKLAQQHGDHVAKLRTLNNVARIYQNNGNLKQALELQHQAYALALEQTDPALQGACLSSLIAIYSDLREHHKVLELAEAALPQLKQVVPNWWFWAEISVIKALLALKQLPQALARSSDEFLIAQSHLNPVDLALLCDLRAKVLLALGRPAEALQVLLADLPQLEQLDPPEIEALGGIHIRLAEAYEDLQEYQLALHHAKRHVELQDQLHQQDWEQRKRSLTGQVQMQLLQTETELERLRNVELVQINHELKSTQTALLHQATHDALTGLFNRSSFRERAQNALQDLKAPHCAALLFIDLNNFKVINDSYGHAQGDALLKLVAERLQQAVSPHDLVARMGGDEFLLYLHDRQDAQAVQNFSDDLLTALQAPYDLGDLIVEVSAALGYTLAFGDHDQAEELIVQADLAMHRSKQTDLEVAVPFDRQMMEERLQRHQLQRELRSTLSRSELELYYQGRFDISGETLVGMEALLRWNHPRLGLVLPAQFIALAEESRLILPIGRWVLLEACRQAQRWNFTQQNLCMSVNVSALQFEQPEFVQTVQDSLNISQLPPQHLMLELTESLVMRDPELARRHLQDLHALGVQFAIDDFGTGYSSFSVLNTLPFNHLKIDRSFLQGLDSEHESASAQVMMQVLIYLAHKLNMEVTAEGVEKSEHLHILQQLGCDFTQGYLLGLPEPADKALYSMPSRLGPVTQ